MVYDLRALCYILVTFWRKARSPNAVKEEEERVRKLACGSIKIRGIDGDAISWHG